MFSTRNVRRMRCNTAADWNSELVPFSLLSPARSGAELMQGVPNAASAQDQLVGGVFSFCIEPKPQRRGFFSKKQWSSGWEVVQFGWLPRVRRWCKIGHSRNEI
ncbi:hypothetical protein V2G26_017024 [Clonostachys chloroleuca]